MSRAVVVVAAGSGTRLGIGDAKAFVPVAGELMLTRAVRTVFTLAEPAFVVVVAPAARLDECRALVADRRGCRRCPDRRGRGRRRPARVRAGRARRPARRHRVGGRARRRPVPDPGGAVRRRVRACGHDRGRGRPGAARDRHRQAGRGRPGGRDGRPVRARRRPDPAGVPAAGAPGRLRGGAAVRDRRRRGVPRGGRCGPHGPRARRRVQDHHPLGPRTGRGDRRGLGAADGPHRARRRRARVRRRIALPRRPARLPGQPGLSGHSDGDAVAHAVCDACSPPAASGTSAVGSARPTPGTRARPATCSSAGPSNCSRRPVSHRPR